MEKSVAKFCRYTGITGLIRLTNHLLQPDRALILMYHRLKEDRDYEDPFCQDVLGPEVSLFENQMQCLNKHYNVVPLEQIVASLRGDDVLQPTSVAITFDDGYKDTYTLAYPILKKYGLPATVFLATGFVGTDGLLWYDQVAYLIQQTPSQTITLNGTCYSLRTSSERQESIRRIVEELKLVGEDQKCFFLKELQKSCGVDIESRTFNLALSWDEVREMSKNGITFGAHTVTHPILTRISKEAAKEEVLESKLAIEREVGNPVRLFAYPNGKPGDYNREIQQLIESCGFTAACSTLHGPNKHSTDRFALRRLWIGPNDTLPIFKAKLVGILPIKERLRQSSPT